MNSQPTQSDGPLHRDLWYYHNAQVCTKLYGVAPKGIKDISKDGLRAVDGYLQVGREEFRQNLIPKFNI